MINRDGASVSVWQGNAPPYNVRNTASNEVYDVAIVGGGITGISTAFLLQRAGKKCIVFEAHNVGYGTTGGTTAHLNTLLDTPYTVISKNFGKDKARLVANITADAIELIKRNVSEYAIDCGFEEADAFLFSQNKDQTKELENIYEASTQAGLLVDFSDAIPIPIPFEKAIRVEKQAKFSPLQYLYGLAKAYEQAGGIIVQDCRVMNADDTESVEIDTSNGHYRAKALIYATHIPTGINILHLRCSPNRSYVMAVKLRDRAYPKDLCYDMYNPYHYYRTQEINGEFYLIAGGEDHKTGHEQNTEKCFLKLESHIRRYFNVQEVSYRWSSQYYEPSDGLPYIGHLPGHPGNIYVATGYGGNGMTFSNVAAIVLSKMLLGEESVYFDLFNPNRIKPVAGFVNFIKHNADVIKEFAGKWFGKEKLEELAEMAPGEGKVVSYNNHTIALYKDESGELYAINPACTHMKCAVSWNMVEKSWDCSCHGSRFSPSGEVLNAPADLAMEQVEIKTLLEEQK